MGNTNSAVITLTNTTLSVALTINGNPVYSKTSNIMEH